MPPTLSVRMLLAAQALVALVGLLDAAVGGQPDLMAVFVMILATTALLGWRVLSGRPTISLRRDLARWLVERAALDEEGVETVADRAVAAYRADVTR